PRHSSSRSSPVAFPPPPPVPARARRRRQLALRAPRSPGAAMTDTEYVAFLERRSLSPHRAKSREEALNEQLALIERQIERRERTAKHAPSAFDAERIEEKIE